MFFQRDFQAGPSIGMEFFLVIQECMVDGDYLYGFNLSKGQCQCLCIFFFDVVPKG